jgi:hypothetical protein
MPRFRPNFGLVGNVVNINQPTNITAGVVSNAYDQYSLTRIGDWPAASKATSVVYLVVGGGGGGANNYPNPGFGGGAGGYFANTGSVTSGATWTVGVGPGGYTGASGGNSWIKSSGSCFSWATVTSGNIIGWGGGYGSGGNCFGGLGGSSGGAGHCQCGLQPTLGYGLGNHGASMYKGGECGGSSAGGGGGGAGGPPPYANRAGGAGVQWPINAQRYAAGGQGGGCFAAKTCGIGGSSGFNGLPGTPGAAGTGSGGAGTPYSGPQGTPGGNGVVIIGISTASQNAASYTGAVTYSILNGYRLYTFTGAGTITF